MTTLTSATRPITLSGKMYLSLMQIDVLYRFVPSVLKKKKKNLVLPCSKLVATGTRVQQNRTKKSHNKS